MLEILPMLDTVKTQRQDEKSEPIAAGLEGEWNRLHDAERKIRALHKLWAFVGAPLDPSKHLVPAPASERLLVSDYAGRRIRRAYGELREIDERLGNPIAEHDWPYIFRAVAQPTARSRMQTDYIDQAAQRRRRRAPANTNFEYSSPQDFLAKVRNAFAERGIGLYKKWPDHQIALPDFVPIDHWRRNTIEYECKRFVEMCRRMDIELDNDQKQGVFAVIAKDMMIVAHALPRTQIEYTGIPDFLAQLDQKWAESGNARVMFRAGQPIELPEAANETSKTQRYKITRECARVLKQAEILRVDIDPELKRGIIDHITQNMMADHAAHLEKISDERSARRAALNSAAAHKPDDPVI